MPWRPRRAWRRSPARGGRADRLVVEAVAAQTHGVGVRDPRRAPGARAASWSAKSPLPQASSGLPSPVIGPMTRSTSARVAADSGGSSSPAVEATSRISSAWPPEAVITASRGPRGQRSPWQQASTSVISSMSATSMARCARSTADSTRDSPARPPVWLVIARRVRSLGRPSARRRACRGRRRGRARPRSARDRARSR